MKSVWKIYEVIEDESTKIYWYINQVILSKKKSY
jgi:hypothetical protein